MTDDQALASGLGGSRHMVEMFETTESMTDRVSTFVLDGLRQGDAVLLAMRLPHWNLISTRLTAANVLLSDAVASGRLTVLDAARTLARMSRIDGCSTNGRIEGNAWSASKRPTTCS